MYTKEEELACKVKKQMLLHNRLLPSVFHAKISNHVQLVCARENHETRAKVILKKIKPREYFA